MCTDEAVQKIVLGTQTYAIARTQVAYSDEYAILDVRRLLTQTDAGTKMNVPPDCR